MLCALDKIGERSMLGFPMRLKNLKARQEDFRLGVCFHFTNKDPKPGLNN